MTLLLRLWPLWAVLASSTVSGIVMNQRGFQKGFTRATTEIVAKECPACNCPPATEVRLQTLDMEALKKIKGDFNYSPQLSHVQIIIESKDSLMLKSLLKNAK